MPESVRDRPTSAYEMVFLMTKRPSYFYDAEAVKEDAEYGEVRATFRGGGAYVHDAAFENSKQQQVTDTGQQRRKIETRNARNVWTIATQPYSGAHFATMPPDLAERCIKAGTSEKGQCPHCGKAWGRVVEHSGVDRARNLRIETAKAAAGVNEAHKLNGKDYVHARRATGEWSPSCDCPEHAPVPQAVLDPFGGAGTTGLVADRLGRHATLLELNPEYAALARERITADAPLLGAVA
jgi:hypothetical protein